MGKDGEEGMVSEGSGRKKREIEEVWSRRLYICSVQYEDEPCYLIHDIELSDLLSPPSEIAAAGVAAESSDFGLTKVAHIYDKGIPYYMGCGVFDSKIIFAGGMRNSVGEQLAIAEQWEMEHWAMGSSSSEYQPPSGCKDIYVYEVDHLPPQKRLKIDLVFKAGKNSLGGEFQIGKPNPIMVELKGKLYALGLSIYRHIHPATFEMFDPAKGFWAHLPPPPYHIPYLQAFSCAIVGTKIMVSSPETKGVFCYDVAASEPEWHEHPGEPLPFIGRALVLDSLVDLDLDLKEEDDFKIMFGYAMHPRTGIVAYKISNSNTQYPSIEQIQRLQLELPEGFSSASPGLSHRFVHLGGRKVCFVSSTLNTSYLVEPPEVNLRLLVVTYDISFPDIHRSSSFDAKLLGSRIFEIGQLSHTGFAELLGCFVL